MKYGFLSKCIITACIFMIISLAIALAIILIASVN